MMQIYKNFMQYNQILVVEFFMIKKGKIKIKKKSLNCISQQLGFYAILKIILRKHSKRDANINALHRLCYKLKKEKEAQTPFCQAELQNNLKLDTDPSRHRKFSYFLISYNYS